MPIGTNNINDVGYYIFFESVPPLKIIKFIIKNSEKLKKKREKYDYFINLLNEWKLFYEETYDYKISIEI